MNMKRSALLDKLQRFLNPIYYKVNKIVINL